MPGLPERNSCLLWNVPGGFLGSCGHPSRGRSGPSPGALRAHALCSQEHPAGAEHSPRTLRSLRRGRASRSARSSLPGSSAGPGSSPGEWAGGTLEAGQRAAAARAPGPQPSPADDPPAGAQPEQDLHRLGGGGGGGQAEFPSGTGRGLAAGSSLPKRPLGGPLGAGELRAFLPQGPRTPSTQCMQMVVVALEPGTALELRLGAEVLVLAPHAALQLTLGSLALVVVPARVLSSSEALWFPAHARWLWPGPTQAAWAINVQDGSLCAQRAEPSGAPPAPEDGEARRGCRPPAGPWAGGVPGLSPSSPHTLLLQALRGAPARQGCGLPPEPRAGLRPLPAEFSLDLRGLGPPPSSELRPLPPSPSPSPRPRSCRAPPRRRPPAKARRRLFRGD